MKIKGKLLTSGMRQMINLCAILKKKNEVWLMFVIKIKRAWQTFFNSSNSNTNHTDKWRQKNDKRKYTIKRWTKQSIFIDFLFSLSSVITFFFLFVAYIVYMHIVMRRNSKSKRTGKLISEFNSNNQGDNWQLFFNKRKTIML